MKTAITSLYRLMIRLNAVNRPTNLLSSARRHFHRSGALAAVKPFILADIGEGIKEVQIIQWFVQPGARVEQFDKICEVQSDKASVEITSRFDGVIKKLHYDADAMAQVGKPLCDIDIQGDISPADEKLLTPESEEGAEKGSPQQLQKEPAESLTKEDSTKPSKPESRTKLFNTQSSASLATPAVRGLLKKHDINIEDVHGTGKDGRVLKEDVHKFVAKRENGLNGQDRRQNTRSVINVDSQEENKVSLSPIQFAMFKSMTKSLAIPHFLYADEVNLSPLSSLRYSLNDLPGSPTRLSYLPFVIKAVSIALLEYPILNSRVEASENGGSPRLVMREKHNIGVAMDTPQGLLVPNIKNVASLSVYEIAEQLSYLVSQAKISKLSNSDLNGGTITVSNIGSIGGTYTTPLIVSNEVAILATGRSRTVPAFNDDGAVVKKTVGTFSWSADHRVIDGATMARMANKVKLLIEQPGLMAAGLR